MHIVNAMFSKGLGGIEQALVDYSEALKIQGHKVSVIISPKAKIKAALLPIGVNIIEVKNFAAWDFFAKAYIKKIMKQLAPDAVIAHGNRAISLTGRSNNFPIIGVTHNYSIKHLIGLDAILATTNDLRANVISGGQPENSVYKLPNMVRAVSGSSQSSDNSDKSPRPITIGTMGRFVKKKGFDVFIRAIADLKARGLEFKALIGGGGEEEENLKKLASDLGIGESLEFIGWVNNKAQFFDNIDIFCLPSLHEPFGIILLEAFAYKKPVVAADSEGPSEIISNNEDALLVPKGDAKSMADAILRLCDDTELAKKISQNAFAKAEGYDIKHFAASLSDVLSKILKNKKI